MKNINIISYTEKYFHDCLNIIKSNTPEFFAEDEVPLFEKWLIAQENGELAHKLSEKEYYFVIESEANVVGCGGYLLVRDSDEIYLAWGMVNRKLQKLGFGKELLEFRFKDISEKYPERRIALTTTQDIAPFFIKYGFEITNVISKYYSETLDRVEMKKN